MLPLATRLVHQHAGGPPESFEQEPLVPLAKRFGGEDVHEGAGLFFPPRAERCGYHDRFPNGGKPEPQFEGVRHPVAQRDLRRSGRQVGRMRGDEVAPVGKPLDHGAAVVAGEPGNAALAGNRLGHYQRAGRRLTVGVQDRDLDPFGPKGGRSPTDRGGEREGQCPPNPMGLTEKTHEPALLEVR